jgi:hypothetical protein
VTAVYSRYELPADKAHLHRRAVRLESWTIGFFVAAIPLLAVVLGQSQAMKAAGVEDILALTPPVAFLIANRYRNRAWSTPTSTTGRWRSRSWPPHDLAVAGAEHRALALVGEDAEYFTPAGGRDLQAAAREDSPSARRGGHVLGRGGDRRRPDGLPAGARAPQAVPWLPSWVGQRRWRA